MKARNNNWWHWYRKEANAMIAHTIRHQHTKQFRAVIALEAQHRWCLTGTPIQNVVDDLGALVRFLRVPQLSKSSEFRRYVAGPIEQCSLEGLSRLQSLLKCTCIRRTKDLLNLPEPSEQIESLILTEEERAQYNIIGYEHKQAIEEASSSAGATSGLFHAILRLRMFCNTGLYGYSVGGAPNQIYYDRDLNLTSFNSSDRMICAYCSCDIISSSGQHSSSNILLGCSHLLCHECTAQTRSSFSNGILFCPVCQDGYPISDAYQEEQSIPNLAPSQLSGYSSKLHALARDIFLHNEEKWYVRCRTMS